MKIAMPKNDENVPGSKHILLPLTGSEAEPLTKYNSKSFDLQVQPGAADTATYRVSARILKGAEDVRTSIQWVKDTWMVIEGVNALAVDPRKAIVRTLLAPNMHNYFETAMTTLAQVRYDAAMVLAEATDVANGNNAAVTALTTAGVQHHTDDVQDALSVTIAAGLPFKCLQRIKRYLRRDCRKPADMKVRVYGNHLSRINTEELPYVPPAAANQALSDDELIDILLFGTPKAWQREMDRQGFDPLTHDFLEVVTFMERVEASEDPQWKEKANASNKNQGNKKKKTSGASDRTCLLHGPNTHPTSECRTLQAEAKRLKGSGTESGLSKKKFGNKTWNRKATENKIASSKEINAFIKKAIAKGVKKELNSADRKRKADDSSIEDGELCLLEDQELKDFNYADMDKLTIDDKDVTDDISI